MNSIEKKYKHSHKHTNRKMDILFDNLNVLQEMMDVIIRTMVEESQYDDFLPEFDAIEESVETLEDYLMDDNELFRAYKDMWSALYYNKGSLDCTYCELLYFQKCVDDKIYEISK